jgi:hypothetical protein
MLKTRFVVLMLCLIANHCMANNIDTTKRNHFFKYSIGTGIINYNKFVFDVSQTDLYKNIDVNGAYKPILATMSFQYHYLPKKTGLTIQYKLTAHSYNLPYINKVPPSKYEKSISKMIIQYYLVGLSRKIQFKTKQIPFCVLIDLMAGGINLKNRNNETKIYYNKNNGLYTYTNLNPSMLGKSIGINLCLHKDLDWGGFYIETSYIHSTVKYSYDNDFVPVNSLIPFFEPKRNQAVINTLNFNLGVLFKL